MMTRDRAIGGADHDHAAVTGHRRHCGRRADRGVRAIPREHHIGFDPQRRLRGIAQQAIPNAWLAAPWEAPGYFSKGTRRIAGGRGRQQGELRRLMRPMIHQRQP